MQKQNLLKHLVDIVIFLAVDPLPCSLLIHACSRLTCVCIEFFSTHETRSSHVVLGMMALNMLRLMNISR